MFTSLTCGFTTSETINSNSVLTACQGEVSIFFCLHNVVSSKKTANDFAIFRVKSIKYQNPSIKWQMGI